MEKTAKDKHNQLAFEDTMTNLAKTSQTYWFLTNRNNLLDVLSSGMIKPASQYVKYYHDLGDFCKDAIPLLTRAASSDLIQEVMSTPELFPILLEIELGDFQGKIQTITEQYEIESSTLQTIDNTLAIVVNGVIPVSCLRSIHFRSATEKDEHIARQYENVHNDIFPMQISPAYFEESSHVDVVLFLEKLALIGDIQKLEHPETFKTTEAIGGALLTFGYAVENNPQIPMFVLVDTLNVLLNLEDVTEAIEIVQNSTSASRWLPLLPLLLLKTKAIEEKLQGETSQLSEVSDIARILFHSSDDIVELLLFETVVHVLALEEANSYYNEETLLQINVKFEEKLKLLQLDDLAQIIRRYANILSQMQSVLRSTVDINTFPVKESPVATSLLFFLLRSEPIAAFSWYKELPAEFSEVLANTITFAGLLYGKTLIPIEYRPSKTFELFIDEIMAQNIAAANKGLIKWSKPTKIEVPPKAKKGETIQSIKLGNTILLQREMKMSLETFLNKQSKSQQGQLPVEFMPNTMPKASEPAISSVQKTPELTPPIPEKVSGRAPSLPQYTQILEVLQSSDLKDGIEREIALYLCHAAKWDECVAHTISLEGRKFALSTSHDVHKLELRVYGTHPLISETLISTERFRRRLVESWESLPERIRSEVINRLLHGTKATRITGDLK